ncbi:MAG: DUF962 domain-containing protein [Flavobacteriales bacterium]|nr:DUF962 domain-containing protein [Flavobacteriales bacterium]
MPELKNLLTSYGKSHQNKINKAIHWICIPAIMFSLLGLLFVIPFPADKSLFMNWATIFLALVLLYYIRLSFMMFLGFAVIGGTLIWSVNSIYVNSDQNSLFVSLLSASVFVVAWVFQFIGHKIEGEKPSFLEDLQFLLIGPAWLLHFIYGKLGLKY